jgi:hypothetical protein
MIMIVGFKKCKCLRVCHEIKLIMKKAQTRRDAGHAHILVDLLLHLLQLGSLVILWWLSSCSRPSPIKVLSSFHYSYYSTHIKITFRSKQKNIYMY